VSDVERRYSTGTVEVRANAQTRTIGGYALKYNKLSQNLGGFVERVLPGSVDKSLADGVDVLARFQHEDQFLLGRTSADTLALRSDGTGLEYDVNLPDTSYANDLYALASRGDVKHSSFAFRTMEDEWSLTDQGFPLRSLVAVQLVDVAPVVTPAYMDTTSGIRSLAAKFGLSPDEVAEGLRDNRIATIIKPAPVVIDLGGTKAPDEAERSADSDSEDAGQVDNHPALSLARRRSELQSKRPN
jgi:HK97 family phage prohead protease